MPHARAKENGNVNAHESAIPTVKDIDDFGVFFLWAADTDFMETTPTFKTITPTQKTRFASTLRDLRERDEYSVAELADILGVTTVSVYQWESGVHCPRPDIIQTISLFFNVPIMSLFGMQASLDDSIEGERE